MAQLFFPLRIGMIKSRFHFLNIKTWHFHDSWIFEALEARIYSFIIPKCFKPSKQIWEHLGQHIIFANMDIKNSKLVRRSMHHVFFF